MWDTFSISTGASREFTVAVVGDENPSLVIDSGTFDGYWSTLEEGSVQFSDRDYTLTGVPDHLLGATYYRGPCKSGEVTLTVSTTGMLFVLASEGNGGGSEIDELNFDFDPEAISSQTIAMHTESFPDHSNFYQWRWGGCTTSEILWYLQTIIY